MKIKGKDISYVQTKMRKYKKLRGGFLNGAPLTRTPMRRPTRIVRPAPNRIMRPPARVIRPAPRTKPMSQVLAERIRSSTRATVVEPAINELPKRGRPKGSKNKKTEDREPANRIEVQVPNFLSDKERVDVVHSSNLQVLIRKIGNVPTKVFKKLHQIDQPYSKYMRAMMAKYPKTTVTVRDDDWLSPAGTTSDWSRYYANCGLSRLGIWLPGTKVPSLKDPTLWAQTTAVTSGQPDFLFQNNYIRDAADARYTPLFCGADYVNLFRTPALQNIMNSFQSSDTLFTSDIVMPLARKRLTTTITNRNAYSPTKVYVYVIRNRESDVDSWARTDFAGTYGVPAEYRYTPTTTNVLDFLGVPVAPVRTFNSETSIHPKASPIMGVNFQNNYEVVSLYKKVLGPGDTLDYTLSVGTDGFSMTNFNSESGGSPNFTYEDRAEQCIRGDYQIIVAFKGASMVTAGFRKFTAAVGETPATVTYPPQMAFSGLTNPCQIDVRTKVQFDVYADDFYQLNISPENRIYAYNGGAGFGVGTGAVALEQRMATFKNSLGTRPRAYTDFFNVGYSSLVDSTPSILSTETGYFVQVASDTEFKNFDSRGTLVEPN